MCRTGNFPEEDDLKACGAGGRRRRDPGPDPARTAAASRRTRSATRTGPLRTRPTCPATALFGWSGQVGHAAGRARRRRSPSTCSACSGWRSSAYGSAARGSARARVRVGGVPLHEVRRRCRTRTTRSSRSFLIWRLLVVELIRGRAASSVALSGWTKFAALVVAPLWLTYPGPVRAAPAPLAFAAGFRSRRLAAFSILLLDADIRSRRLEIFCDRTLEAADHTRVALLALGLGRSTTRAGIPDLHVVQRVLEGCS